MLCELTRNVIASNASAFNIFRNGRDMVTMVQGNALQRSRMQVIEGQRLQWYPKRIRVREGISSREKRGG